MTVKPLSEEDVWGAKHICNEFINAPTYMINEETRKRYAKEYGKDFVESDFILRDLRDGEKITFVSTAQLKELFAELKTKAVLTDISDKPVLSWPDVEELFGPLVPK